MGWERWLTVRNNVIAVLILRPAMIKRVSTSSPLLNRIDRGLGSELRQIEAELTGCLLSSLFYSALHIALDLSVSFPPLKISFGGNIPQF